MKDAKAILEYLDTLFDEETKARIAEYVECQGQVTGILMDEALGQWYFDLLVAAGRIK